MPNEIVRILKDDHRIMERVLTLIRLQVDILKTATDTAGFSLLANAVGYMHNSPRQVHHFAEENIFDHLARRAPHTLALCTHLSDQHEEFGRRESALLRCIRSAQTGDEGACRELRQMGVTYCVEHADHIRNEEMEALPQAIKWLPETDWREIGDETRLLTDPISDTSALKHYGNLYDYLMAADVKLDHH